MHVNLEKTVPQETLSEPKFPPDVERELRMMENLAAWLDDRFEIPVLKIKFGLDALLGLIPVGGDAVTAGIAAILIWRARRLGAPSSLQWKMVWNVAFDFILGLLPIAGDVLDIFRRSNRRNVYLMIDFLKQQNSADS